MNLCGGGEGVEREVMEGHGTGMRREGREEEAVRDERVGVVRQLATNAVYI